MKMGMLKDIVEKIKARKSRYKEMKEGVDMQEKIATRKLTPEERELLQMREEERQMQIKQELSMRKKMQRDETWHDNKFAHNPNLFAPQQNIMGQKGNLISSGSSLLGRSNLV
jgi:hypothetical protein